MSFGITELVIILVIVVLLFGTTKLKSLGGDLGSAIKGFRNAVTDDSETKDSDTKGKETEDTAEAAEPQVEKKDTESTES